MTAPEGGAAVQVDCGSALHTVAFEDGRLVARDHRDLDRERALLALGGAPVPCVGLVDAWERHREDLDALILASRGPGDPLRAPNSGSGSRPGGRVGRIRGLIAGSRGTSSAGWTSFSALGAGGGPRTFSSVFDPPGDRIADRGAAPLLALGGGLPRLLVAGIITSWWQRLAERPEDPEVVAALPRLRAATYGRARLAFREWSGRADVDLRVVAPDAPGEVARNSAGLVVSVPLTWLPDVWVPDLATVAGLFCLTARCDRPGHWRIHGVDRNFETLRLGITVR